MAGACETPALRRVARGAERARAAIDDIVRKGVELGKIRPARRGRRWPASRR
jgi:hypothetical protein